ncbi:alkaline phosphatase family protein [Vibrio sp. HN007]|uniref:alkaline phosphatase family protein n=1 Tax=Vibrio iocasae TaxID=3098914 RepID=UPI0035D43164
MPQNHQLPLVLAGPILRRVSTDKFAFWLATTADIEIKLGLYPDSVASQSYELSSGNGDYRCLSFSPQLKYHLVNLTLSEPLPFDSIIKYKLQIRPIDCSDDGWMDIVELMPELLYPGQDMLQFRVPRKVQSLLHGSCRKPHYSGIDGLVVADQHLQNLLSETNDDSPKAWPSILMMSGDQIYADDVAGPMLKAIHHLSEKLSFPMEQWDTEPVNSSTMTSEQLYLHPDSYYGRDHLLPSSEDNRNLVKVLFGGARKPIFTSSTADNHLISLGEYLTCYLLSWSQVPWCLVDLSMPKGLSGEKQELYLQEREVINQFVAGLPGVQRVFAHLPVAMIMDDHDVTDDFNLHRNWEETVYNHPLSKRMIGNGLLAYLINQAWGNKPEAFSAALLDQIQSVMKQLGDTKYEDLIDRLIKLEAWDFEWDTSPPLIVLDTRTRRWRSESSEFQPSGLLDWEALTELQGRLSGHSSVLLVSAAPIFGVKLIEVIQKVVTFLGHPLAVDAENWMAHPGTANGILNVFCHRKTPQNFVVLSGDVHYSFVYDVELRGRHNSPHIWQICSSGLRNSFPEPLLAVLDKLNRWLYSPRSPLNWFTLRRKMRITPRKPVGATSGRRLFNHSGIGLVELDEEGRPIRISQLTGVNESVVFEVRGDEASWH